MDYTFSPEIILGIVRLGNTAGKRWPGRGRHQYYNGIFLIIFQVKYVIIDGIAAILYGVPRATFDLDKLIEATPENALKLIDALIEAGFGTAALTSAVELLQHEITIFRDRVRIDVQTSIPGISFDEAWLHRQEMAYGGQSFYLYHENILLHQRKQQDGVRTLRMSDCWNWMM